MRKQILFAFVLIGTFSCKLEEFDFSKNNIRAIQTWNVSGVTRNSAVVTAKVITTNGESIKEKGVCYSTSTSPTVSADTVKGTDTSGSQGAFMGKINKLIPETKYYARPYATNSFGTAYGEEISFTTLPGATPSLFTGDPENVTLRTAHIKGQILDDGGYPVTERGIAYSNLSQTPTLNHITTTVNSNNSSFEATLSNLTPGTRYYARAYAINKAGIGYGRTINFTTIAASIPGNITTAAISNITLTTATGGGTVGNDGGAPVTVRGLVYSKTITAPTLSNGSVLQSSTAGTGTYTINFSGLEANTTYYVRAYATNSSGTGYGPTVTFKTLIPALPSGITTSAVSGIGLTTATGGGSVTADGGSPITTKGICYSSTSSTPTITNSTVKIGGSGLGTFNVILTDLTPNTLYYVRAYATNSTGTAYGPLMSFRTLVPSLPSGISTNSTTNISHNSAQGGGFITSDGGSRVIARGICLSSSTNSPTINNSTVVISGSGTGVFSANLSGLQPNTTYYVRAFATNVSGTAYGNVLSFKTNFDLSVGALYQGGTIAYIFKAGDAGYKAGETHGLIVSNAISQLIVWGCQNTSISTSSAIGSGNDNTLKIINACAGNNAARYAYNLVSGGYSDWYLPSYIELQRIDANKALLSIPKYRYWSSTQDPTNVQTAYAVDFEGNYYVNVYKSGTAYVLPVRSF